MDNYIFIDKILTTILITVTFFGLIVFVCIKTHMLNSIKKKSNKKLILLNKTSSITKKISKNDPNFSSYNFLSWVKEIYVKIKYAYIAKDASLLRAFENENLFLRQNEEINKYIKNKYIKMIDGLTIQFAELCDYKIINGEEILTTNIEATMKEYTVDDKKKIVIDGSKENECTKICKLIFVRKYGVKTIKEQSNNSTHNCPNCAAPIEVLSNGICKYCGKDITSGDFDFVLDDVIEV